MQPDLTWDARLVQQGQRQADTDSVDRRLAALGRRVLFVAWVYVGFLALFLAQSVATPSALIFSGVPVLLVCLLGSLCACCGVKYHNSTLLRCFCAYSLFQGCCAILSMMCQVVLVMYLDFLVVNCPPYRLRSSAVCLEPEEWSYWCTLVLGGGRPWTPDQCYGYLEEHLESVWAIAALVLLMDAVIVAVHFLGFCWGSRLMRLQQHAADSLLAPDVTVDLGHVQMWANVATSQS